RIYLYAFEEFSSLAALSKVIKQDTFVC
ncbi:unnamed protein product, partial [Allacma fusca]